MQWRSPEQKLCKIIHLLCTEAIYKHHSTSGRPSPTSWEELQEVSYSWENSYKQLLELHKVFTTHAFSLVQSVLSMALQSIAAM